MQQQYSAQGENAKIIQISYNRETMFNPSHFGLYFTMAHVEQARKDSERASLQKAWAFLRESQMEQPLAAALLDGLRYRFDDDTSAGERAFDTLQSLAHDETLLHGLGYVNTIGALLAMLQAFEMTRPFASDNQLYERFSALLHDLNQPAERPYLDDVWRAALNIAGGVVLEWEEAFQAGVEEVQRIVREDLHPQGYVPKVVGGYAAGKRGENIVRNEHFIADNHSLQRLISMVSALVLAAEAASHAGVDLWGYNQRSVSVMTPVPYVVYYYYRPEQWRWDAAPDVDSVRQWYAQQSGWLEMAYRRSKLKDIERLLADFRPIFDVTGGGLTTLSHALPKPRGLFG